MDRDETVVELNEVTKVYPGAEKTAVSKLSLTIHAGEILALLGPNGAGKTTAVKMIAGLVLPTKGTVRVSDFDMITERAKGVRHIGAVLEGARNLYWRLSALENLRYFGSLRLVPRRQLSQRIDELLALFGLAENRHQEVRHFSRGMQQKLAIAAALIHDPDILLLDEPTLGLDVKAGRQLEETVTQLAREQGKAILLTTHMMDVAERLADRIAVIHKGQKIVCDQTHALLEQHNAQQDVTEIQVSGSLPQTLVSELHQAFPNLSMNTDNGLAKLTFPSLTQAQLIQVLKQFNEHRLDIRDVGRRRARLEEIFLSLTEGERGDD